MCKKGGSMRRNIISSTLSILPYVLAICAAYSVRTESTVNLSEDGAVEHLPSLRSTARAAEVAAAPRGSNYGGYILLTVTLVGIGYHLCTRNTERVVSSASTGFLSAREQYARAKKENEDLKKIIALFGEQNRTEIFSSLDRDIRYEPRDGTPEEFICPITREIMRHPVKLEGQFYECSALKTWYERGNPTSPLTRNPMPDPSTLPIDLALRTKIAAYIIGTTPARSFST